MDYIELLLKAVFVIAVLWALNPLYRTLRSLSAYRKHVRLTRRLAELKMGIAYTEARLANAIEERVASRKAYHERMSNELGTDFDPVAHLDWDQLIVYRQLYDTKSDLQVHYEQRLGTERAESDYLARERTAVDADLAYWGVKIPAPTSE